MANDQLRTLAAIMFTDIVGYTAMMQADEKLAKQLRDRHRELLQEYVVSHQGRIMQYYGDGSLSIFGSAIEAVTAATSLQVRFQTDRGIPVRIGLHLGDIVYDDEGVFGDGVNVASRIEALGSPGAVLISDKVVDEIRNHPSFRTSFLGSFQLKNVQRPVGIFAIANEGLRVPTRADIEGHLDTNYRTLAVLPFLNISSDPENEYFSDGITEELLNALAKVDGLRVTSRTSSFSFKGKHEDIRQIAKSLDVSTILEGSVRKAGKKVRITAQLIDAKDGYHLWTQTFDRELDDIFEVQDEIANTVARNLQETLSSGKRTLITKPTQNMKAYSLYLQGRFHLNKWTPDGARKAIQLVEEAIAVQPDFAFPFASIAYCYSFLGALGQLAPRIAFPKGREAALQALTMDEKLADPHVGLALIHTFFDWDFDAAQKEFSRALELNSGSAEIHHLYSYYLTAVGDIDQAIVELEHAVTLDPLSLAITAHLGEAYSTAGRLDDAEVQLKKTLDLEPAFRPALNSLGWVYVQRGDLDKAIRIFEKSHRLIGDPLKGITQLAYAYARSGRTDDAVALLKRMEEREKREPEGDLSLDFAVVYAGLQNDEKVFHYLEKAFEQRHGGIVFMRYQNGWDYFRSDPRFESLMKRIGI